MVTKDCFLLSWKPTWVYLNHFTGCNNYFSYPWPITYDLINKLVHWSLWELATFPFSFFPSQSLAPFSSWKIHTADIFKDFPLTSYETMGLLCHSVLPWHHFLPWESFEVWPKEEESRLLKLKRWSWEVKRTKNKTKTYKTTKQKNIISNEWVNQSIKTDSDSRQILEFSRVGH